MWLETDLTFFFLLVLWKGAALDLSVGEMAMSALILQMLSAFCLLHIASNDQVSTHPGENVKLHCNTSNYWEISWYRLRAEEMKLLISAQRRKLNKKMLFIRYNVNENQFAVTESGSLVIIDVKETDLGFYYCGAIKDSSPVQFGKPIRLNFTDDDIPALPSDTQLSAHSGIIIIILPCACAVCVSVAVICSCVYCSMLQDECSSRWNSDDKEFELQPYELTSVTYTSVS